MNRTEYLARIGVGPRAPDENFLRLLQRQHLLSVPFENLDIHWDRPISLETAKFYKKVVLDKRGGFCYELNGLFNDLLADLGFQTRLVSARVGDGNGNFSPEYDHAAIIVTIGNDEFLADVGFGEFSADPLRLVPDKEQSDDAGVFVIRHFDGGYLEAAKKEGDGWLSQYIFKSDGHDLAEFAPRCDFQQYSPDSHFRKGKICSLMTNNGRKTLTDAKFIVTSGGKKTETAVKSQSEFDEILLQEFGIRRPA